MCEFPERITKSIVWDNDIVKDNTEVVLFANPDVFPDGQMELPSSMIEDGKLSCYTCLDKETLRKSPHVEQGKTRLAFINICDAVRNPVNPKNGNKMEKAWHQSIIRDPLKPEDFEPESPFGKDELRSHHAEIVGKKKLPVKDAIRANARIEDLEFS